MRRLAPASRSSRRARRRQRRASARAQALHLVRVAHFAAPVYATSAPGEPGNLYVVEQAGRILVLCGRPASAATPFLDIRSQVRSGGEQGLLSVAFDPDYAKSHRFYVDYTDANGDTRVVQYRSNGTRRSRRRRSSCSSSRTSRRTTTAASCSSAPTAASTGGTATAAAAVTRSTTARASSGRSRRSCA